MSEVMTPCKAGCGRLKPAEYEFCCHGCTMAADGGYEVHESGPLGHTERCEEREKQR